MKYLKKTLIMLLLMLVTITTCGLECLAADTGTAHVTGKYYNAAVKAYGIKHVLFCSDYNNDIMATINAAYSEASTSDPVIVYAGSGKYAVTEKRAYLTAGYTGGIYVPKNVIFVAEKDTVITDASGVARSPLVLVSGSVYGGYYNCNYKVNNGISFRTNTKFSTAKTSTGKKINGNVEYAEVVSPSVVGINAIGDTNVNINHNIVRDGTKRATTGIGLMYGAVANSISYNKVYNIGSQQYGSGISVTHSDAVAINGNSVRKVAGHGISTDTEQSGHGHAYCRIKYIKNNTISGAKHGIWLEERCNIIKSLSGNKISNCTHSGIAMSGTKSYVGKGEWACKWSVYNMSNNTITNINRSNLSINGVYGKVRMGSGNTLDVSRQTNCVSLDNKAKLYITGSGNIIKRARGNGINVANGSYVKITGKNNRLCYNKGFGVSLYNRGIAYICYTNLNGNTKGSARAGKGSSLRLIKCYTGKVVRSTAL